MLKIKAKIKKNLIKFCNMKIKSIYEHENTLWAAINYNKLVFN